MTASEQAVLLSDKQLLDRFVVHRDEAAFEALVHRHAPLVWGVCRRILERTDKAEDAFQATFLVFLRKAGSIAQGDQIGPWLYGVAYRVALRARANAAKRRFHERQAARLAAEPSPVVNGIEFWPILDAEIQRLPRRYRTAFILCYLEGKTNEEAAKELGCPKGTVASRLARARERLRSRLTRQGFSLSSAALTGLLSQELAFASAPRDFMQTTLKAAGHLWAEQAVNWGAISAPAAGLAKGVLRMMSLSKLKNMALASVFLALLGVAGGLLTYRLIAAEEPRKEPPVQAPIAQTAKPATDKLDSGAKQDVPSQHDGVVMFIGTEIKEGEKVPDDQVVTVKIDDEIKKYRRLKEGDRVQVGQLLGRLDDRLARDDYLLKQLKVELARSDYNAADKTKLEAKARYDTQLRLRNEGKRPSLDEAVRAAKLLWDKLTFDVDGKRTTVKIAELELKQAQHRMQSHEIRSSIDGVIKKIYKQRGEGVRAYETVMLIQGDESKVNLASQRRASLMRQLSQQSPSLALAAVTANRSLKPRVLPTQHHRALPGREVDAFSPREI
jgi:RNA polymerase sigma factor (sigma-70 family)